MSSFQGFVYKRMKKKRLRKRTVKLAASNDCPIKKMESTSKCCEGNCTFNQEHDCLLEKYFSESNASKKQEIVIEAIHQNAMLKEQIDILKAVLGLKV